jgi:hypothetical protein
MAAETKIFQIGSRDIRQQSGASARVAKSRNGTATQDRIVGRARDVLCTGREARRSHLQVHCLALWTYGLWIHKKKKIKLKVIILTFVSYCSNAI